MYNKEKIEWTHLTVYPPPFIPIIDGEYFRKVDAAPQPDYKQMQEDSIHELYTLLVQEGWISPDEEEKDDN